LLLLLQRFLKAITEQPHVEQVRRQLQQDAQIPASRRRKSGQMRRPSPSRSAAAAQLRSHAGPRSGASCKHAGSRHCNRRHSRLRVSACSPVPGTLASALELPLELRNSQKQSARHKAQPHPDHVSAAMPCCIRGTPRLDGLCLRAPWGMHVRRMRSAQNRTHSHMHRTSLARSPAGYSRDQSNVRHNC